MTQETDTQIVNFKVDEVNYGVPVEQVSEVREMQSVTPIPGAPHFIEGVTNLRGKIMTVMDLRKRLGLEEKKVAGDKIIVIDNKKSAIGVVVDSVTEVSTVKGSDIDKTAETVISLPKTVLGVGKQDDQLVIILDLLKIVSEMEDSIVV